MMLDRSMFVMLIMLPAVSAGAQTVTDGRPSVVLEGRAAQVTVDLGGGSIVGFQFKDQRLNPLSWTSDEPGQAHPMGHFLCLDRWGAPSEAESKNGMPFHGEASHVQWTVVSQPGAARDAIHAEMAATLPMAGFKVMRSLRLAEGAALLRVTESVTNNNKLGRVYNMVQHPSIAPPFLDASTVVDCQRAQRLHAIERAAKPGGAGRLLAPGAPGRPAGESPPPDRRSRTRGGVVHNR